MSHPLLSPAFTLADVTVILATKGRRHLAQNVCKLVAHRPLFLAVNEDRPGDAPECLNGATVVHVRDCPGSVHAMETALLHSTTSLVCFITDDVDFPIAPADAWLIEALRVYNHQIGWREGLVAINDGKHAPNTAAFPLMHRNFYMRNCFPSPYVRYYIDPEWTKRARDQGVYAFAVDARLNHKHLHGAPDENEQDKRMFKLRNPGPYMGKP